ncbi:hypothetical protein MKW98_009154 [Papaver atlanticum]|uniref:DUF4408 domain-containing protein n=1 Tax=Papaver atlanticum TaxID=357466 RepID=A0AAD4T996_9MAGN|nr:hypothetical protein MKW98_009154 [Papaver atlanticum]
MLEESVWATMNSWCTPTVLFLLMNVMIGVVAVASGFGTPAKPQQQQAEDEKRLHPQLVRSPSRLERLKSMNFYRFRSEDFNPFNSITTTIKPESTETATTHHVTEHNSSDDQTHEDDQSSEANDVVPERDLDEIYHNHVHVQRTTSDTKPASGVIPMKLPKKMKKSASVKSAFSHFEEEDIVQTPKRPSTVKEGKTKSIDLQSFGDDEEVDAKADDFINRFKQQLKLQRLDSILRYKETIKRG